MALKMSPALRSARANQISARIGGGTLEIRSGAQPANTDASDAGTLLCVITLPASPFTSAWDGVIMLDGSWTGSGAAAAGAGTNAGHFRIKGSGGAVELDGSITVTGGGGDMTVVNLVIAHNQPVEVISFSYTDGNA